MDEVVYEQERKKERKIGRMSNKSIPNHIGNFIFTRTVPYHSYHSFNLR